MDDTTTLTDAQHDWATSFSGIDTRGSAASAGQPADPAATTTAADPNAAPAADPNAGQPADPAAPATASDPSAAPAADPNAAQPADPAATTTAADPNAAPAADPNAGQPAAPAAPTTAADPNAAPAADPSAGQPTDPAAPATASDPNAAPPADPNAGQPTDPGAPATASDPNAAPAADPNAGQPADPAAPATASDPNAAPAADPNAGQPAAQGQAGDQTDAPKKINVTIITSYGQSVRYWIQDRAIDHDNEAPEGQGTVLIDGDTHGPDESIGLTCIETANGASICYTRESNPFPPGSQKIGWSSVTIPDGGSFKIQETGQTTGASAADPGAANAGPAQSGDANAAAGSDPAGANTAPPADPNAAAGADPNAAPPADPNAAAGADPNAAAGADPNAASGADPNAAPPADPNAAAGADPNAAVPADPNAAPPADPNAPAGADPNAAAPSDPNATAGVDPNAAAPADPNAAPPADPNATAGADPNAAAPADPNAPQPIGQAMPTDPNAAAAISASGGPTTGANAASPNLTLTLPQVGGAAAGPAGAPPPPRLTLGLTDDERRACQQYLDQYLTLGGGPPGDTYPVLGGLTSDVDGVVHALLPLTLAGQPVPGVDPEPRLSDTISQLTDMVNTKIGALIAARPKAASPGVNTPQGMTRDDAERFLTDFLTKLGVAQGLRGSVRITATVRSVGQALTLGDPMSSGKMTSLLANDKDLRKPSELAHAMAQCLPDQISADNWNKATAIAPKDLQGQAPQSLSSVAAKGLHDLIKGLPKDLQTAIEKGFADAVTAGLELALDKAMADSRLDPTTKNEIVKLFNAAITTKDSGPAMDRKQGGDGSPDANRPPPPHSDGDLKPPSPPGETVVKTPSVNTPDTPPPAAKPDAGAPPAGSDAGAPPAGSDAGAPAGANAGP